MPGAVLWQTFKKGTQGNVLLTEMKRRKEDGFVWLMKGMQPVAELESEIFRFNLIYKSFPAPAMSHILSEDLSTVFSVQLEEENKNWTGLAEQGFGKHHKRGGISYLLYGPCSLAVLKKSTRACGPLAPGHPYLLGMPQCWKRCLVCACSQTPSFGDVCLDPGSVNLKWEGFFFSWRPLSSDTGQGLVLEGILVLQSGGESRFSERLGLLFS